MGGGWDPGSFFARPSAEGLWRVDSGRLLLFASPLVGQRYFCDPDEATIEVRDGKVGEHMPIDDDRP